MDTDSRDAPRPSPASGAAGPTHAYTNRLAGETSPYLLQHAHNPVDWYPWSPEAFEKARREDKPLFVSIGYSTCYWCHVMEKESFEDEQVARLLNEHFVAIKVDREERPDLDGQYMLASQLVTGQGGWPNSVWLVPEGKPWMAGTYFPKPQFLKVLEYLATVWRTRRPDVDQQADQLAATIARIGAEGATVERGPLTLDLVDHAVAQLAALFDADHGGLAGAPKFPPHGALRLLMRQYRDTGNHDFLPPITRTLDAMWLGGLHDHVGGGFHRYSTDAEWLVPHFEKMLYDNAQLLRAYLDGYLITGRSCYREAVEDIFIWLQREMTSPDGAFYTAIDAGEVGREGQAYVWRVAEIREVLGNEDAKIFEQVYQLNDRGNFSEQAGGEKPGTNILHLARPVAESAAACAEDPVVFARRLGEMRQKLLARRLTHAQPHKDDKVLAGWNGLMIAALACAGRDLNEPRYTQAATAAAEFILARMIRDGTLLRTWRAGAAKQPAYLDDYAYLAAGLIELHRATKDQRWLVEARRLAATLLTDFQDQAGGGFYYTTAGHEELLARSKGVTGGGNLPDANGVAVQVLLDLGVLTGDASYVTAATAALEALAGTMRQRPAAAEDLLFALARLLRDKDVAGLIAASPPPGSEARQPDVRRRSDRVTIEVYASQLQVSPGDALDLEVALDIDAGWHLYAANPGKDFLVPATVAIEDQPDVEAGAVRAPEPRQIKDPVTKNPLQVYQGRVWFHVLLTVAADTPPGELTVNIVVRTQACDNRRCLLPQTNELRLTLKVDPETGV